MPAVNQEQVSVELIGDSATVTITGGTVTIWLGRSMNRYLLARIIQQITKVDYGATHECVVFCSFEEIGQLEAGGYILTSYARKGDKYRAAFLVPLSQRNAADIFIDSLLKELENSDVKITIKWAGLQGNMKALWDLLDSLNYFDYANPIYKEAQL
jgi:hypothetical protein